MEMVITKARLGDDERSLWLEYWLSRPIEERISAVEELRIRLFGQEYVDQPRFPRTPEFFQILRRLIPYCGRTRAGCSWPRSRHF